MGNKIRMELSKAVGGGVIGYGISRVMTAKERAEEREELNQNLAKINNKLDSIQTQVNNGNKEVVKTINNNTFSPFTNSKI